jgi:hypothetical protein
MKFRAFSAAVFGVALISAQAATFTVTTTDDSGPGSLRQAILDANVTPGDDAIVFATNGTITLASPLPPVTDNTTIAGPGTNQLTISGNNSVSVFTVNAGTTSAISGLTIANGRATNYANGAGIASAGKLTVSNCVFVSNQNFGGFGGAVFSSADLTIINSTFAGNHVVGENGSGSSFNTAAGGGGAGIGGAMCSMSGALVINGCSFTSNSATGGNGGGSINGTGNGCGGGPNHGCGGSSGGFGSAGGGAVANTSNAGNGGLGGGGGGAVGQYAVAGSGGFGGGGGGTYQGGYNPGGGGAGIGGAIFVNDGSVTILASLFAGNQAVGGLAGSPPSHPAAPAGNGAGVGPDFYTRTGIIHPTLTATTLGGGTVAVDPPIPPYLSNSWALVTATPSPGWRFLFWLGDASGTNETINVKVTRDKYVQAVFGTTLTNAALISVYPQSDFYPYGTLAKLTALPPAGTYFSAWSGDVSGTNNPLSLSVTNPNQSVSYQLGALSAGRYALTVVENGRGRVEISPRANDYNSGQTVTLTAVSDVAQDFIGWSGDASGTSNQVVATMDQSKVITATFTKRPSLRVGTPLEGLTEDGFRLTLFGEFGAPYTILGSTNLADWIAAGTVTNTYGIVQLTDPVATNLPFRFYRATSQ